MFRAMQPLPPGQVVRGQFCGYREGPGLAKDSQTETSAALRLAIGIWRWAGMPFNIRAGKKPAGHRHAVDRPLETPADGDIRRTPYDRPELVPFSPQPRGRDLGGYQSTTMFVRQGHYEREAVEPSIAPPPDVTIERIDELAGFDLQGFDAPRAAATESRPAPQECQ